MHTTEQDPDICVLHCEVCNRSEVCRESDILRFSKDDKLPECCGQEMAFAIPAERSPVERGESPLCLV